MKPLFTLLAGLAAASVLWAQTPDAEGEVTKVDTAAGRLTLRHSGVKSLDMPPMTMTFRVSDARLLQGVAAGDHVRFAARRLGGNYTVVALVKAP
jgi:Cu/Ag efflux protein CusF